MSEPRVYVACLASYNSGVYSGAWRTADQLEEGLRHPNPSPAREEWAIHDTEGVPFIGENPDIPHLIEIMRGIEECVTRSGRGSNLTPTTCGTTTTSAKRFKTLSMLKSSR